MGFFLFVGAYMQEEKDRRLFYIKKCACAQFYRKAYRDILKILYKCLVGFRKLPMIATKLT